MRVNRQTVAAITTALKEQDKSIPWLAKQTGIPYPTLHRKLTHPNAKAIDMDELDVIADALAIPAHVLTAVA